MFIYEDGLPISYVVEGDYPDDVREQIEAHMLSWIRSLPGQARVRRGKVDSMLGQEVNLKRLENE